MARVKLTTDKGDWSTIPVRIRLAVVALVGTAGITGLLAGLQVISIATGAVVLGVLGIGFVLMFDRRRPWWPDEPELEVDPIATNAGRKILLFGIAAVAGLLLMVVPRA